MSQEISKIFAIVDCNNFYASCERVFDPKLEKQPVIILSSNDGCVISRSNEAKALGIMMGVPYFKIQSLVKQHNVKTLSSNFTLYGDMSARIMNILDQYSPHVENYSIDECFLDFTGFTKFGIENYAKDIIKTIKKYTGIPVSIGIAPTKTLAKVANLFVKQNPNLEGVFSLNSLDLTYELLKKVDIGEVWGIGRKYKKFLNSYNIMTAYDFIQQDDRWIKKQMNILALKTAYELKSVSCINIEEQSEAKKSITVSRSFSYNITSFNELKEAIIEFTTKAAEKLRQENKQTKYLSVYIKTNSFRTSEKQYKEYICTPFIYPTDCSFTLIEQAIRNLTKIYKDGYGYKKAGIMFSDFYDKSEKTFDMFDIRDHKTSTKLMSVLDLVNQNHGKRALYFAGSGVIQKWQPKSNMRSRAYTSNWNELIEVK